MSKDLLVVALVHYVFFASTLTVISMFILQTGQ